MGYRTPESAVADKVLAWLKQKEKEGAPLFWEHRSGGGGFSYRKGIPDLYVVAKGQHLEIELKAANGKPSPMQQKFAFRCLAWQIPYACPHSAEEAIAFIEGYLK